MKKIFSVTACIFLGAYSVKAQTFSEWFRQNKTQIKYLISQIAAYEVFRGDLNQGYNIAKSGLTFISDTTGDELALHSKYFNSLKVVSPAVAGYSRINDIINYESAVTTSFKKILQAKNMTAAEINYLNRVYGNMLIECSKSLDELTSTLTDNTYTMTNDQRITRIDGIYRDIKDKYAFSQSFNSEALLLSAGRQSTTSDIKESLINNGLQ